MKFFKMVGPYAGFFADDVHGPRTLLVPDEGATHPVITVEGDGEMLDPNWQRPLIAVPNPNCLVPADAVEITDEVHRAMMIAQAAGKIIDAGVDGSPIAIDPPPPTAAEIAEFRRTEILAELASLDVFLPRAVEDMWVAMEFDTTTLPQAQQDRLARKIELRDQISSLELS